MSSSHVWIACLLFSCFIHWQMLGLHWATAISETNGPQIAVMESSGHFHPRECSFALQQMLEQATNGQSDTGANRQKQIRANYLKKIRKEINHQKFSTLGPDTSHIIGNACYCFFIDKNGKFDHIRLVKSSGNPRIDRAARQAIFNTSQKVARPNSTGTANITLGVTVKYQYNL